MLLLARSCCRSVGIALAFFVISVRAEPTSQPTSTSQPSLKIAAGLPTVLTGIDVLKLEHFQPLVGRRVGLITNHSGIDHDGRSTINLLRTAPNVQLVTLFSPEHGIGGDVDRKLDHTTDPTTGLPIYSLYGKTQRPTADMLQGIDTLVFDIQDVGARFYTYVATLGYALEEAARHRLRFVVLDRPNPIGGTRVFGPLPDRDGQFTCYHKLPLVHGMTLGELAQLFNRERAIGADLIVVPMRGWLRSMWFDQTGQLWVNPSPNIRGLTAATLYPAIGMLEACRLSVGRGTDAPFERLGGPWIEPLALAAALNARALPGIRFIPARFTPAGSKFQGKECGGVQIVLTNRDEFDPVLAGLCIAETLERLFGDSFDVEMVDKLICNRSISDRLASGTGAEELVQSWTEEVDEFRRIRGQYLLYP